MRLPCILDTFQFFAKENVTSFEDIDAGHGRVETRKCTVTGDLSDISKPNHWEKLQTIVRIDRERYAKATRA